MAIKEPVAEAPGDIRSMIVDKQWLREQFAAMDARTGFVVDPTVTAEKVRAMMLAEGIRPEDNVFSRAILRERYPEDYPDEPEEDDSETGARQGPEAAQG
jgi:hypothetical protein